MRKSCKKPPDRTKSVKGGGNMKLSAIALKNLKRNFSFYSLYLFSVSFVLMIYFCFTSFSMNQIIMEKISSDGRVETMCRTVAVFIMAFVIFYMFYSNSFFMRRRTVVGHAVRRRDCVAVMKALSLLIISRKDVDLKMFLSVV